MREQPLPSQESAILIPRPIHCGARPVPISVYAEPLSLSGMCTRISKEPGWISLFRCSVLKAKAPFASNSVVSTKLAERIWRISNNEMTGAGSGNRTHVRRARFLVFWHRGVYFIRPGKNSAFQVVYLAEARLLQKIHRFRGALPASAVRHNFLR